MIKVSSLNFSYDEKVILKDVSFEINSGEFIAVIGPNGCGKTTLLKLISGLLKPAKGKILLNERNLEDYSGREIAKTISVVSQNTENDIPIPIIDYVLTGRLPHHDRYQFFDSSHDEKIAERAMKLTEIYSIKDKLINQLSGGERQLASIAKALAQQPQLLLLDEPTNHLDINHQEKILELLKDLNRKQKLTVFLVLHDLNLACEYCDRLIVLNKQSIHSQGQPNAVLTKKLIQEIYNLNIIIGKNPVSQRPYILLSSKKGGKQ